MKTEANCLKKKKLTKAFTLIEMIGVLAVIAILAALLIPKIFEAINNARISNASLSYNTVKTALADHYAKYGSLLSNKGTPLIAPVANFDKILVGEGFLDKPFQVKIGTPGDANTYVEIVPGSSTNTAVLAGNEAYDLDGSGVATNDAAGSAVVVAVISGVTGGDAQALSTGLDGASLSASDPTAEDLAGRVKYAMPAGGITIVRIYVTHR